MANKAQKIVNYVNRADEFWSHQPEPLICFYCGNQPLSRKHPMKHPLFASIDHYVPRAKHGSGSFSKNGVVACGPSNRDKGQLLPEEWNAIIEYRRKKAST